MKVKIKKLDPSAVIPKYAKEGDAGMDLTAISIKMGKDGLVEYGTGLSIEIPKGYVGLIFARSSIYKLDAALTNAVGVIDSGYRGEIKFKFKALPKTKKIEIPYGYYDGAMSSSRKYLLSFEGCKVYNVGDRIGQIVIMPYPEIEFEEVSELSTTNRGNSGYGSTGN